MHTQRERNFAAVVQVVLDNVPDNPLACMAIDFTVERPLENMIEVGGRPFRERGLEHVPGDFETVDQLGGADSA